MTGIVDTFRKNPYALQSALLFFLLGSFFIAFNFNAPPGDYANYYYGSAFCHSEKVSSLHNIQQFNDHVHQYTGSLPVFVNYNPVPPFSLLFYQPFILLPVQLSKQAFNFICLLLFCFSWYRLIRLQNIRKALVLVLPLVFFLPLKSNIEQGQSYLLIFSLMAESFMAFEAGKKWWSAVFLALAIALKIFPAFMLLYFVFRKDARVALYSLLVVALLCTLTMPLCGVEVMKNYFVMILPKISAGEINDPWAINFQSMEVLLRRLFVRDELLNNGALHLPYVCMAGVAIFLSFLLAVLWSARNKSFENLLKFALTAFVMTLFSGYGSGYGLILFAFLIPAFCNEVFSFKQQLVLLLFLLLVCNFPVYKFFNMGNFLGFMRLYLMLILLLVFLLFSQLKPSVMAMVFFLVPIALISLFRYSDKDEGKYFLSKDFYLLNTEFGSVGHTFFVRGLNNRGVEETKYFFSVEVAEKSPFLELKNNQIFYKGKQITFKRDLKKNPQLLSNGNILYLSDENRGAGFFTIRVIETDKTELSDI